MTDELLIVAGEASGDRIAAMVAAELAREGVGSYGIGGPACRAAGVRTIADSAGISAMGLGDVVRRARPLASAVATLGAEVWHSPPRAALLVNFTELNQRLGRVLRARGVRVLWCVAPQVWAWRPGRLASARGAFDRIAVVLPFEEALWRNAGHDAVYVGHPAWTDAPLPLSSSSPAALAVLAGSRSGEVTRLAEPLLQAASALLEAGDVESATVVVAAGLAGAARALLERSAAIAGIAVVEADPMIGATPHLARHRASLCASGTASLEAALAGAAPVVAYRMDAIGFAVARRLVRTPHIALPNILLGRGAYPELLQEEVTPARLAFQVRRWLSSRDLAVELAYELRRLLAPPSDQPFGRRVAELLLPWLSGRRMLRAGAGVG